MRRINYCDWRYILCFILWTFVIFVNFYPHKEPSLTSELVTFLIWMFVSFWIIDEGKKYAKESKNESEESKR